MLARALLALLGYVLLIFGLALGLDTLVFRPAHRRMRLLDEDGLVIAPWEAPLDEQPEDAA